MTIGLEYELYAMTRYLLIFQTTVQFTRTSYLFKFSKMLIEK